MNKQEKAAEVEFIKGALGGGHAAFVLAPKGLTVNQVSTLRRKIRASQGRYRVLKNRLALRAIDGSAYAPLAPHLKGESALAYGAADPAPLAKAIEEFCKDHQGLTVKAGIVDGRLVGAKEIKAIADLPPRPVLVARLLGALRQPMVRLVTVLQAPARDVVRAMDQIAKKKDGAAAPAAGAETPAP
ncbi:MAG TPA: 50S ribosomal protein L10 [Candidatus Polarisedimenticolia bacterium]|nr:50S ribosomal protein L10 [Candidatus Polarisedimenticolia bacterium]